MRVSDVRLTLERCAEGRLRAAYPVGAHDVEVRVSGRVTRELLAEAITTIKASNPHCRRLVFAAAEGDGAAAVAAEQAGFRYVVDVDLRDAALRLFVHEPGVRHLGPEMIVPPLGGWSLRDEAAGSPTPGPAA